MDQGLFATFIDGARPLFTSSAALSHSEQLRSIRNGRVTGVGTLTGTDRYRKIVRKFFGITARDLHAMGVAALIRDRHMDRLRRRPAQSRPAHAPRSGEMGPDGRSRRGAPVTGHLEGMRSMDIHVAEPAALSSRCAHDHPVLAAATRYSSCCRCDATVHRTSIARDAMGDVRAPTSRPTRGRPQASWPRARPR